MIRYLLTAAVAIGVTVPALALQVTPRRTEKGELVLYELTNFRGGELGIDAPRRTVELQWPIGSIGIHPGDRWQICAEPRFRDPCIILDQSVPDAKAIGINGGIGSVRPAPAAAPAQ